MKANINKLENALRIAANQEVTHELDPRWKMDLMRRVRTEPPRKEPVIMMGPIAWKWAGAALAAAMILSIVSSRYGEVEDYIMLQSEISQSADYMLAQSL